MYEFFYKENKEVIGKKLLSCSQGWLGIHRLKTEKTGLCFEQIIIS